MLCSNAIYATELLCRNTAVSSVELSATRHVVQTECFRCTRGERGEFTSTRSPTTVVDDEARQRIVELEGDAELSALLNDLEIGGPMNP